MATQGKYDFDYVPIDPHREGPKPIKEGIMPGTLRSRWSPHPPTYRIACEHCGHEDTRTEWQAYNQFKCYECHQTSRGLVPRGLSLEQAEAQ